MAESDDELTDGGEATARILEDSAVGPRSLFEQVNDATVGAHLRAMDDESDPRAARVKTARFLFRAFGESPLGLLLDGLANDVEALTKAQTTTQEG